MNKLLSIKEAASFLGVSTKTLRRWEGKGTLVPQRTPGNQRRYNQGQLDNFRGLQSGEPVPEPQSPIYPERNQSAGSQDASYWVEEGFKSIASFKKMASWAIFVMVFVAVSALAFAALKSAGFDKEGLTKALSMAGIGNAKPQNQIYSEVPRYDGRAVLGASSAKDLLFGVNLPSQFAKSAQFLDTIRVAGIATLSGGIITENSNIDAGTGTLTASNVVYGLTAGDGIDVGPGQNPTVTNTGVLELTAGTGISVGTGTKPTISNTGVTALGGSTGALALAAGTGISISGLTITNKDTGTSQNIFKTIAETGSNSIAASSNTDTLTFASGSGILLSTDSTNKKVTIAAAPNALLWQENSGALAPTNITDDLLLGGTSTSSAKFAFINVAGGTPTATISASSGNNATYITGDGTLATTNKQTLTIGSSSTGNIVLSGFGAGVIHSNASGVLSSSAVNLAGGSSEVTGTLPVGNGGTGLTSYATGDLIYASGVNTLANRTIGSDGQVLSVSGGVPAWTSSSAVNFWQRNLGALSPDQITNDLLLGGTTTAYAKFAFINNIGSGTPTASISANSGNNVTFLTGLGNLGTTNAQTLTLGGTSTGNIVIDSGSSSITLSDSLTLLGTTITASSLTTFTGAATAIDFSEFDVSGSTGAITINDDANLGNISIEGTVLDIDSLDFTGGGTITSGGSNTLTLNSGSNIITFDSTETTLTATGLATITSAATLGVSATILNLGAGAAATIGTVSDDNLSLSPNGTGDIRLVNDADTDIIFPGFTSNGGPLYTNGSGVLAQTTAGASSQCLLGGTTPSFGSCGTGETTDVFWNQTSGLLYSNNSTVDFAIGGQATTSAKFAVLNMTGSGTPTASVSATSTGTGIAIGGDGSIQSLLKSTLTLGGGTTGNIIIDSNGAITLQDPTTVNSTLTTTGAITAPTASNTINGLVINGGIITGTW